MRVVPLRSASLFASEAALFFAVVVPASVLARKHASF